MVMHTVRMGSINWFQLIVALIIPQVAGGLGTIFTSSNIKTWYVTLTKPTWNPPNWIFGPVWTTLFLLMGISSYIVYRAGWERSDVKWALGVFAIQLVLNVMWSALFFGARNPGAAVIEIAILWLAIAATIVLFYRISPVAGLLMVPYLCWVSFAAYLNYTIWQLN